MIIETITTYLVCYIYYLLYSYNEISQRKENVTKKTLRKRIYIYSIYWKKSRYKWTQAVQTGVVQGSTIYGQIAPIHQIFKRSQQQERESKFNKDANFKENRINTESGWVLEYNTYNIKYNEFIIM